MRLFLRTLSLSMGLSVIALSASASQICGTPELASSAVGPAIEQWRSISREGTSAMTNVTSLAYVKHLIDETQPRRICLSAMPLAKNSYQYTEYLIMLEMIDADGQSIVHPLVFQNASIQAFHNSGPKVWSGLDRRAFNDLMVSTLRQANWSEAKPIDNAFSPIAVLTDLFPATTVRPIDSDGRGSVHLPDIGSASGAETYLVTQLRILPSGATFTQLFTTDFAVVRVDRLTQTQIVAPLPGFFEFSVRLRSLRDQARPTATTDWTEALRILGR